MNVQEALKSQYHAAMAMLKQAIEQCPAALWAQEDHSVPFWRVALPKLDHQINNIRHIQHHAALLAGRLRLAIGTDIPWVGPNLG